MAAARFAVKTVDWTKVAANVPKSMVAEYNAFRTKHESLKGQLNMLPEKPAPVNWDHYLANVKNVAFVEKMQAAYAQVSVPYPEDTQSGIIQQQRVDTTAEILAQAELRKERVAAYQAEIAKLHAMKPFEEITTKEHMANNPELVAKVDAELKEIGWK